MHATMLRYGAAVARTFGRTTQTIAPAHAHLSVRPAFSSSLALSSLSSISACQLGFKRGLSFLRRPSISPFKRSSRPFSNHMELPNQSAERFFVYTIIAVNTAVFLTWKVAEDTALAVNHGSRLFNKWLGRFMTSNFLISSNGVLVDHKFHTLVTSFFSHDSIGHFAMNMFSLFFFGMNACNYLGVARFATLYFGGGLLSSVAFVAWPYVGKDFGNSYYSSRNSGDIQGLGASGAISALIGESCSRIYYNVAINLRVKLI
jgi:membrane associated rhomboid family serine protease